MLIAKIYYAKLAVFRFVNRENLFRKNFRRPKFLLRRYWCLLIYGPDLLVLMTSWVSDKFDYLIDNEKFSFPYIYGWIWVGMSFFQLGVGGCNLFFLTGCGWVWPFFGWVWPFLDGCGSVWPFFGWMWVGVGECTIYNCPKSFKVFFSSSVIFPLLMYIF